jgi:hypothetical protein
MSEKYYAVSESELLKVVSAAIEYGYGIPGSYELLNTLDTACRAREVRFIGAADQGSSLMLWGEVKK